MLSRRNKPDVEKCKDSGLALVLICLLCYLAGKELFFLWAALVFLLAAMTCPRVFQPFAIIWFALSAGVGGIVSKIILTALFFGVILPISLLRRFLGKDSMQLRCWKDGNGSVFRQRNQKLAPKDLEQPY